MPGSWVRLVGMSTALEAIAAAGGRRRGPGHVAGHQRRGRHQRRAPRPPRGARDRPHRRGEIGPRSPSSWAGSERAGPDHGSIGAVGTMLRQDLPAFGWELRGLDGPPCPDEDLIPMVVGDITEPAVLDAACTGAEAVVHLAGIAGEAPWRRSVRQTSTAHSRSSRRPAERRRTHRLRILEPRRRVHAPAGIRPVAVGYPAAS